MDRLILGDNQFFGVSHMSEDRGLERMRRFQRLDAIIEALDAAYDQGIHAFTFSTHDRVQLLCGHFRSHSARYADLRLYPVLPYAQKYAHLVNEKGMVGAVKDVILADNTATQIVGLLARGSMAFLTQDPLRVLRLLVDAELKMFRGLRLETVFLQNNVADLLLGIGVKDVFTAFAEHVESEYGARAGFMTLNLPRMVEFLLEAGIENPIVCSAINSIGFQMNPNRASYEQALATTPVHAVAMSVMAGGAIRPREALEYVTRLTNVRSIVFGASDRHHIAGIKAIVDGLWSS